jgi:hypothetical protein
MDNDIIYLLHRLEDYMDKRADADNDFGVTVPNEEMSFLSEIREMLSKISDGNKIGWLIDPKSPVNSILMAIMRFANMEQKVALRDALIERTPKNETV